MSGLDRLASFGRMIALGLVLAILLLPILLTLLLSFDARAYLGPLPPRAFSLRWYEAFLSSSLYLSALRSSLVVAALAVMVSTTSGVMAALFLHRRNFIGRELVLTLLLSPFVIPPIVVGFGLLMAFSAYGIGNALVRLVAGHILLTMPFTIRTTLVGLQGVKPSFAEAALTLGARPGHVFWEVTFPLIRPSVVASIVLAAAWSIGEVSCSIFLTDETTQTLPVALLSQMVTSFDLTIAAASGLLVTATVTIVFLLDYFIGLERITGGGTYSRR
jgi:putative spermidine/putrescine transport system permease protein